MTKANQQSRQRYPFKYEAFDKLEGKVTGQVWAVDDDEAEQEAYASAADLGCSFIEEISIYKVNDS